jgi:fatty-acyl-CoA synthase
MARHEGGVRPVRDEGVGSWIERRAAIAPRSIAIAGRGSSRTYDELASRVRRVANALRGLGVGRGDRVGWLGPNHPEFLEVLFGTVKLGAVLSPVNHRLEPPAVAAILMDASPSAIVYDHSLRDLVPGSFAQARIELTRPYDELIAASADDSVDVSVGLSEPCVMPFTSGTTGSPKGVVLTHGNVTWNVLNLLSVCDLRSDDVTIAVAPFFRAGGTGVNVLPVLFKGGAVVAPGTFGPDDVLELIEAHRVTVGFANPDLLDALVRSPRWVTADLSSLRFVITGGAPVPERLIRTYLDRGVPFVEGYGLSEAGPVVLLLDQANARTKVGSAGTPPMFVDVRIVRPAGTDCGIDEVGELLARGPNVMAGYWNRLDDTRRAIDPEGWLHTGDAARMDAEGYVWIVDRVKDRYVTPGGTVYPGQVERVLALHPSVAEVGVVGVGSGSEISGAAFVVLEPNAVVSEDELLALARERLLEHEVPRSITFVGTLPRTSVGKLRRDRLRALASPAGGGGA